jgi:hypothetical protein
MIERGERDEQGCSDRQAPEDQLLLDREQRFGSGGSQVIAQVRETIRLGHGASSLNSGFSTCPRRVMPGGDIASCASGASLLFRCKHTIRSMI